MPDELDALRYFRDETPGPSTDAWNRARAAIAAARAEQEPARRGRSRVPGRSRMLFLVTAVAVAAAIAGLVAVLLPGPPATRGTGTLIETTAFVTHIEHALSEAGQRNVVGYARTVYPPGYLVEPVGPGGLRVFPSPSAGSPWSAGSLVRWSYQGATKISAFTAAGQRVFDLRIALVHGRLISTGVFYRSGTWWRGTVGPASGNGPPPRLCGSVVQLGTGGWPAFLRQELNCGEFTKGGLQRIRGVEAVKLTSTGGVDTFWVNPRTYLPVRAVYINSGERFQTDFGWFPPTQARLAHLPLPVPPGFRQVAPPAQVPGR
jgi:hypothetical protein